LRIPDADSVALDILGLRPSIATAPRLQAEAFRAIAEFLFDNGEHPMRLDRATTRIPGACSSHLGGKQTRNSRSMPGPCFALSPISS